MARFNVNAARAQRLETLGKDWEFEVDTDVFHLPTEFPRSIAKQIATLEDNDIDGLLALLLGPEQFERFCKYDVSVQDVSAILEAYGSETGMTLGEG
ncbi:hypothetical protein ACWDR3_31440 [Streptomyces sp. NPDC001002]|jgi:hypothetical protein|uniref:Uncharacterized protein n=1 Tax=Streptomyces pseudovenezuelae TaxID=67350 RepID=A0ABT6LM92_9ACTN|nr:hypothetical protein [Streptomyces pseudovenezuelae]MDH6216761.1 hypothetical protein [Streptomyces pseudovenezuelae]